MLTFINFLIKVKISLFYIVLEMYPIHIAALNDKHEII